MVSAQGMSVQERGVFPPTYPLAPPTARNHASLGQL